MANETVLVELSGKHPGVVVRLPSLAPTFLTYDLTPQALVQNLVAAAGVPAPAPAVVIADATWIGSPFLVMPKVEGTIPGPAPLFDEWIIGAELEAQRTVHDELIDTLASVHAVRWSGAAVGAALIGPGLVEALDHWTSYVEWAGEGEPLPALIEALNWCRRHQPSVGEADASVLLWGDARLGNLVFDDDRHVHAVLDWDLAAIGPPEMDLGWYFGLEFMMEELFGRRVPGFPEKSHALERYESRSGHQVSHLDWHEVFALARALAINDRHQRIAGSPKRKENPMCSILLARIQATR
jgi:aminoglycoside phosphotransferase (APT) family kinase protein